MTKRTARTTRKETPFTNTGKAIERKDMIINTDSMQYTIFKNVRFEATTTMGYLSNYGVDAYNSITTSKIMWSLQRETPKVRALRRFTNLRKNRMRTLAGLRVGSDW